MLYALLPISGILQKSENTNKTRDKQHNVLTLLQKRYIIYTSKKKGKNNAK